MSSETQELTCARCGVTFPLHTTHYCAGSYTPTSATDLSLIVTHSAECWRWHPTCAAAEVDRARSMAVRLENELAEIQRIANSVGEDDSPWDALNEILRVCRPESVDEFKAAGAPLEGSDEQ